MFDPNTTFQRAGMLCETGAFAEAASLYRQLLVQMPGHPQIQAAFGVALLQNGDLDECVSVLRQSLATFAGQPEVWCNLGTALRRQKKYIEALEAIDRALALEPRLYQAWVARGNICWDREHFEEALAAYERAVFLRPDDPRAHFNHANVLHRLARQDEAVIGFTRAVALDPGYAEAFNNLSNVLSDLARDEEALAAIDRALAIKPDYAQAHVNRGNLLSRLKRFDDAVAAYDRAIAREPANADYLNRRGLALGEAFRHREALADVERAVELEPGNIDIRLNRCIALQWLGHYDAALAGYEEILAIDPDKAEAQWNKALLLLADGDFENGFALYERRWGMKAAEGRWRMGDLPQWKGEDAAGKTILIWNEQGFGDYIQFCRYVSMLSAKGVRVILETPPRLMPLFEQLSGIAGLVETGTTLPAFDLHCPAMSLPFAFRTTLATVPANVPYLTAEPVKLAEKPAGLKARVGLVWAGNAAHVDDRRRSLRFAALAPLLRLPFAFHALQKEFRLEELPELTASPNLFRHADEQNNFADGAALVAAMDLVITVDTVIAHLAGAMGKPVWLMLPHMHDWRWMHDRLDSPWYPSMRLFRQPVGGDWASVIADVAAALTTEWGG